MNILHHCGVKTPFFNMLPYLSFRESHTRREGSETERRGGRGVGREGERVPGRAEGDTSRSMCSYQEGWREGVRERDRKEGGTTDCSLMQEFVHLRNTTARAEAASHETCGQ